ncbi:hypothetical protein K458DRAFT_383484 [Lentithecium fluviatile CBS 122367]|uniref:Myb-like domain-containing protein n=1 Tax=Lentithecium fluviatile CBS 122367 TaxID=1168545 RepID=A0A6G1JII1_9PLEO|nr:hypothetical protein K458DRAFT_383484 [Lentithecium fluviatile CBS 122367]
MTPSCSTTLFAPSLSMKIVPYIPKARESKPKPKPKPKPTLKAKSMATTKMAKRNRLGVNSKDGGEWLHIDDNFTMQGSNASLPTLYEASEASRSVGDGLIDPSAGFQRASGLESTEHQFGRESLDEERPDHPPRVAEGDLAMIELLGGISREFPLIMDGDTADHDATGNKPSNVASNCQDGGYPASVGNEEHVVQHRDLDTDEVCALSMESIRPNSPLEHDELIVGDVDVTDRPSATRKRTRPAALDVVPEQELDSRSTKRRRSSERLAENLVCNPARTPKSTLLPTPAGSASHSRASIEPSLRSLDSDRGRDGARTPRSSLSDLCTEDNGGDSTHSRRTSEGLLHSTRGFIFPSESIEGGEDIGSEEYREGGSGGGGASESHNDAHNQDHVSRRLSAKTSQRRTRSGHLLQEKRYGPLSTALRRQGSSTTRTRASRQVASSQPQQLYRSPINNRPRSCSPPRSFLGTKAGGGSDIKYRSGADMSIQITDLTLCDVPNGSSIVTGIIRCHDSKQSPDLAALGHRLFGGEGKVIRVTQLLRDSWMLVGYRYKGSASNPCSRKDLNSDWMSSSRSNAASHKTDDSDDDWDEKSEKGEESREIHSQRTRKPWLESEDVRLRSLKDRQGMGWEEICQRFPNRTLGALRLRYYTLRKNDA